MTEKYQPFLVFKSEPTKERRLSRPSQNIVKVMLLLIRSVSGPVILVFFCQTKNRLSDRKSVSERHHFLCCSKTNRPVTWGVMSLVTVTRQTKHHCTDDLKNQRVEKCKTRMYRGSATHWSKRFVALPCDPRRWDVTSWMGRHIIFNWARDCSLNSLAADIDVRYFDFRSPFLQFARMRFKLMLFRVESRVCSDASDVTNPRAAVEDTFGHG